MRRRLGRVDHPDAVGLGHGAAYYEKTVPLLSVWGASSRSTRGGIGPLDEQDRALLGGGVGGRRDRPHGPPCAAARAPSGLVPGRVCRAAGRGGLSGRGRVARLVRRILASSTARSSSISHAYRHRREPRPGRRAGAHIAMWTLGRRFINRKKGAPQWTPVCIGAAQFSGAATSRS